jgi:hypothetical protein
VTKLSKLSSANFFNVLVSLKTWFIMLDGDWPNVLETMDLNNDDMADLYCYRLSCLFRVGVNSAVIWHN